MSEPLENAALVCCLGRLGQHCVLNLKELGLRVYAIDFSATPFWHVPGVSDLLDGLVTGDCRRQEILEQACVRNCRAILLTGENERVNITAALAARSLNPDIRIVIRAAESTLTQVLSKSLGNFVSFEPAQLPATAFALAGVGGETRGLFRIGEHLLRVFRTEVTPEHPWCNRRRFFELNTLKRRIVSCAHARDTKPLDFHDWDPEDTVALGDRVTGVEFTDMMRPAAESVHQRQPPSRMSDLRQKLKWTRLREKAVASWTASGKIQKVAIAFGAGLLFLGLIVAILYRLQYPDMDLLDSLNIAVVLILSGYGNVFASKKLPFPIPGWLLAFSLILSLAGTLLTGILFAFLTERVLAARLQFLKRQPPMPKRDFIAVAGLGNLGKRVTRLFGELREPTIGMHDSDPGEGVLANLPLLIGKFSESIRKIDFTGAKSFLAITNDDVLNLELALAVSLAKPSCRLVIRADDPQFGNYVSAIVPNARTLGVYSLSAEAFAAAALGEEVLSLIRLGAQTTLVVQYVVEPGDTLENRLLADVAYGYGVVPIMHARGEEAPEFFPSDDTRIRAGDRLVVLASVPGLVNIEQGVFAPRSMFVRVERSRLQGSSLDGFRTLARVAGCDLATASEVMGNLPARLPVALYMHQARRLVRELSKERIDASVCADSPGKN